MQNQIYYQVMATLSEMIRAYLNSMQLFPKHFIKRALFSHFLLYHNLTTSLNWVGDCLVLLLYQSSRFQEYIMGRKTDEKPYRVYPMGLILIQKF